KWLSGQGVRRSARRAGVERHPDDIGRVQQDRAAAQLPAVQAGCGQELLEEDALLEWQTSLDVGMDLGEEALAVGQLDLGKGRDRSALRKQPRVRVAAGAVALPELFLGDLLDAGD